MVEDDIKRELKTCTKRYRTEIIGKAFVWYRANTTLKVDDVVRKIAEVAELNPVTVYRYVKKAEQTQGETTENMDKNLTNLVKQV